MALGKDRKRINVKGGGTLKIRELSPNPTDAWSDLGIIESVVVNDVANMIDIPDAAGNALDYKAGSRRVGLEIMLMQTSIDEITWLKNCNAKYYDVLYNVVLDNGTSQQYSFCLCAFQAGPDLNFAGSTKRSLKITGVALAPKAAFARTPTSFNIVINEPYVVYENATPAADPSDAAATLATAII